MNAAPLIRSERGGSLESVRRGHVVVVNETGAVIEERMRALFNDTLPAVYGFLRLRTGSGVIAEDLAATTFEEAARLASCGRIGEVTPAWLMTVARRRLIDHWRRTTTERQKLRRLFTDPTLSVDEFDPAFGGRDDAVLGALDSLSQRQRTVLTMRYLDDMSVSEIAERMGMGYKAAESLLARGRRAFRAAYHHDLEVD